MTKSIKKTLIIGLLIVLISCNRDNGSSGPDPKNPDVIVPLKVGNQWILQLTYSDTTRPGFDTMRVTKDTLIQNERWFFVQDSFFGPNRRLLTNRSNGVWARNNQSVWLLWKYPSFAGDAYVGFSDTVHVISTTVDTLVPGGRFQCYQYRDKFGDDFFLSPNVGFVKFPEFAVTDTSGPVILRTVRLELLRAVLN